MKKFLVHIMIAGEMFTELMSYEDIIRMLDVNISADYIDSIHIFDVSEFGKAEEIDVADIWSHEFSGVASLSDSDFYAMKGE